MFVALLHFLQGYLKIRVTGYSPERFLNLCKNKKIAIWGLESFHNAYDMYLTVSGFRKLKPILKKTQTKVSILERFGLPFFFHRYRKRKFFFAGIAACILIIYSMTFFIWDINIEGNQSISTEVLLRYLETEQVYHGMTKRNINCAQIGKKIRQEFDKIIWVSVSMDGTRLFVRVKENADTFTRPKEDPAPSDIVAVKDGTIVEIITRSGIPQVTVGSVITKGDLLVSGTIDVLNDAKEVISHHYVTADADIVIQTTEIHEDYIEKEYFKKIYTGKKRKIPYIEIGKHTIQLGIRKHNFKQKEQQTTKHQLQLSENFYLPISFGQKIITEYQLKTCSYTDRELEIMLKEKYEQYCRELEAKEVRILEKHFEILPDEYGMKGIATLQLWESTGSRRKIIDFE